jgi:hypothetical protein
MRVKVTTGTVTHCIKVARLGGSQMITFALGILLGAGCLAVYNEMYTRWLYADVKRRAKQQGISDRQMKDALVWATKEEIEANLIGK